MIVWVNPDVVLNRNRTVTDVSTTCAVVKMATVTAAQVVETVTVKDSPFRTIRSPGRSCSTYL